MPAISTSFSATTKPFLLESDSRIFHLLQKFNFLESLHLKATHIKDSALLTEFQTSFNLLFEEQKLYLSADTSSSSVIQSTSFSSSLNLSQVVKPAMYNSSVFKNKSETFLTPRKIKKQERGKAWKQLKQSSSNSFLNKTVVESSETPQAKLPCLQLTSNSPFLTSIDSSSSLNKTPDSD